MREYDPNQALLSLHVFKTGGTSFMSCLKKWFGKGYYQHYTDHETGRRPYIIPWNDENWTKVHNPDRLPICINGHFTVDAGVGIEDYYPGHNQIVTFFRNPVEAHFSAYYFQRRSFDCNTLYYKGEKLEEFPFRNLVYFFENFRSFLLDDYPWDLTLDNFKEVLSEHFIHIGLTESMQVSNDIIADKLGKPRVKIKKENVTPRGKELSLPRSMFKTFREKNPLAFAIYDWVKELNDYDENSEPILDPENSDG